MMVGSLVFSCLASGFHPTVLAQELLGEFALGRFEFQHLPGSEYSLEFIKVLHLEIALPLLLGEDGGCGCLEFGPRCVGVGIDSPLELTGFGAYLHEAVVHGIVDREEFTLLLFREVESLRQDVVLIGTHLSEYAVALVVVERLCGHVLRQANYAEAYDQCAMAEN